MYCTTDVKFYCQGDAAMATPKFQAMLDDLAAWLREKHPEIDVPDIDEPVTEDDLQVGYEEGDLPDE